MASGIKTANRGRDTLKGVREMLRSVPDMRAGTATVAVERRHSLLTHRSQYPLGGLRQMLNDDLYIM